MFSLFSLYSIYPLIIIIPCENDVSSYCINFKQYLNMIQNPEIIYFNTIL